jgi:7-keto-8-aminopelargonate synthetase-like enzyme
VRWRGRRLIYFSGCDYFRLSRDPQLAAATRATLKQFGLSVSASRLTTGNHNLYQQLETELAQFFGAESAVLLPDGYFAGMAVTQALAGEFTHALLDEFAHGALVDAARMLDCPVKIFKHREAADLARVLAACGPRPRPLVLTDGMFSFDGSVPPLPEYLKILPRGGLILVDDAHGAGVLGKNGRGTLEQAGVGRERIIQCATLSKAFGAYGGVVLATRHLRKKILARSRAFVGTTPLPLPLAGAALAALQLLRNGRARRNRLFENLNFMRTTLRAGGWEIVDAPGPIIRLPNLAAAETARLKNRLLAAGCYPPFLKYPGASAGGIFRLVISSEHSRVQLERLAEVLIAFGRKKKRLKSNHGKSSR